MKFDKWYDEHGEGETTKDVARLAWEAGAANDGARLYDLIIPDVIGILPLLKGAATFGEFGDLEYDGRPIDYGLARAIGTLAEFEELVRQQELRKEAKA